MAYNGKSGTGFLISSLQHVNFCTLPHIDIASHEFPSSQPAMSTCATERHIHLTLCQVLRLAVGVWATLIVYA